MLSSTKFNRLKLKKPYHRNTAHVERKNKNDTSVSSGNWNHLIIIQKNFWAPYGESTKWGTTENSHTGRWTYTS